jgi:hypothetical protein
VVEKTQVKQVCMLIRTYIFLRLIQESSSLKQHACNLQVYTKFRWYTFVGQRYCFNEDMKELSLSFKKKTLSLGINFCEDHR